LKLMKFAHISLTTNSRSLALKINSLLLKRKSGSFLLWMNTKSKQCNALAQKTVEKPQKFKENGLPFMLKP
jgi:hypothetical protein